MINDLQVAEMPSLQALMMLFNSSLDVICSIDENGRFLTLSAAAKRVWGYAPHELVGRQYIELVVEQDRPKTIQAANAIKGGQSMTNFENEYICKDGSSKPISWSAYWDEEEQVMYCVARDATEKKRAEEDLNRAKQKAEIYAGQLNLILESIGDGFLSVDRNWNLTYFNAKAEQLTGHRRADVLGKNFWDVYPTGVNTVAYGHYHRAMREHVPVRFEMYSPLFDQWYEISAYPNQDGLAIYFADVSVRKRLSLDYERTEREKHETASRLGGILESIQDGFFAVDRNWIVTYWNQRAEELLHRKREDIVGKHLWEEYQNAVSLQFYTQYHRAVTENIAVHFEEFFPPLQLWIEVHAFPSAEGLSVYFRDITERKKQEASLLALNERYELVIEATSDAIWDWDVAKDEVYYSSNFTRLFGYSAIAKYSQWEERLHPEDKPRMLQVLETALADKKIKNLHSNYRFFRADGTVAHVTDRLTIVRDEAGNVLRMVGAMQDVTKLKAAEAELKKLSLVATETVNAVVITDADERITWVNRAFCKISGYSLDEAIGKKPGDLLQGPRTSKRAKAYLKRCIQEKRPFSCEILNYDKNGQEYWLEIKGQPIFGADGRVEHFFAIQTDITAKKESEAALKASEGKYRLLFYESQRPKWIFDAATCTISAVNDAALQLYGYSKEEVMGKNFLELLNERDRTKLTVALAELKNGKGNLNGELQRHLKRDATSFYVELYCHTINLPNGLSFIATVDDMTEKLELQQMLIEEKLESQKEISKAIIKAQEEERTEVGKELHDNVNQLLTTVKLYIENIQAYPDHSAAFISKSIDLTQRAINEVRGLAKQLVTPLMKDVGFKAAIDELVAHYRALNLFKIDLRFTVCEEKLDESLQITIYRIVQEMMNNVVKYAKATSVQVAVLYEDKMVQVSVTDNGIGFDNEKITLGLGLKNIENRAELFRGKLSVESKPKEGTVLKVIFPTENSQFFRHN